MTSGDRPRVLVLSRNYPNAVLPARGLWAERLTRAAAASADVTVIAPLPYVPLTLSLSSMARQRSVAARRVANGVEVWHPRTLASMAHVLYAADARLEYPVLRGLVERLHAERPFDVIHAHFIYPDGVVAARLGRHFGVPVVVSEHAFWHPWVHAYPSVWGQVQDVLPDIHTIVGVSEAVRADIAGFVDDRVRTAVLPNVLDDETFRAPLPYERWDPDLLLFVGMVRHVKGLDVLVRSLGAVARVRPSVRLQVVGAEGFMRAHRKDEIAVRQLVAELGVVDRVEWSDAATPLQVAAAMRRAAVLVVPSRRETFCSVAVEALASGTPVVATRCGGPEEFMSDELGRLVPAEDPAALADAIVDVLARRASFDRVSLRGAAVGRFGFARAQVSLERLYGAA